MRERTRERRGRRRIMSGEKRRVLFFARNPHNVAIYERVLRRLIADPRITLHLTSNSERHHPSNSLFAGFDLPGAKLVHHRLAAWMKYDLYVSPDMYLLARRARVKVHTFHGISIKGKAFSEKALAYDKLFLIGPYQRRRFVERGVLKEDDPRFVPIGMPKTDALFDGSLDRAAYLRERGLEPNRRTVLYAPTWRPESSLYSVGEELIRSMRGGEYNFLVKLHDISLAETRHGDWRAKMEELVGERVVFVEESDVTPALNAADLLISDASSVANEFTLLDRPIVFIAVPELFRKYKDTIDAEGWGQSSGPVAATVPEIHAAIRRSFANPGEYAAQRRKIASEGFYNPGKATEAAVEAICGILFSR
jgi:CDP-glycerol glycerophosphotransferase (TagB/SpsB family)